MMKRWRRPEGVIAKQGYRLLIMVVTSVAAVALAACGGSATPTVTPAPTVTPTATATPSPTQEWALEDVRVDGSTVTVTLNVFAGIDVGVTLDAGPTTSSFLPSRPWNSFLRTYLMGSTPSG